MLLFGWEKATDFGKAWQQEKPERPNYRAKSEDKTIALYQWGFAPMPLQGKACDSWGDTNRTWHFNRLGGLQSAFVADYLTGSSQ